MICQKRGVRSRAGDGLLGFSSSSLESTSAREGLAGRAVGLADRLDFGGASHSAAGLIATSQASRPKVEFTHLGCLDRC